MAEAKGRQCHFVVRPPPSPESSSHLRVGIVLIPAPLSLLLLLLPSQQMIHDRYELHPRCVLSGIKTRQRKGQPQSVARSSAAASPLLHFKTIMTSIKRRKKQSPLRPDRQRERGRPDYISRNSRDSNLVPINTLVETLLRPASAAWYSLDLGIGLNTRVRVCHTTPLLALRNRCLPRRWSVPGRILIARFVNAE